MLRIRLTRTGKRHQPTYRIVVAEHSAPVKGKFVEVVGYYLADRKPKILEVKADRVTYWISKGAVASDTVHNMLVDKGILTEKRNIKYARAKAEVKAEVAPKPAEAAPVEAAEQTEKQTPSESTETATEQTEEIAASAATPEESPDENAEPEIATNKA